MAAPTAPVSGTSAVTRDFKWKGKRASDNKTINGTASGADKSEISRYLLDRGIIPSSVTENDGGMSLDGEISFRKNAKKRSVVIVSRQIATMLDAGLTYLQAIDIALKDNDDHILARGLSAVREDIRRGSKFADAMEKHPTAFPDVMIQLVRAGEASGQVKESMNQVADQLEAEDELRAKVKKAMTYPVVVLVISTIIFLFLMIYLIPTFAKMYDELSFGGADLPKLTQIVVGVSARMKYIIPITIFGSLGFYLWYRGRARDENVRAVVDPIKLKLPVFGNLFHKIALARWTRNLAGLLSAGVDTLEALEITAKTSGNIMIERATYAARDAHRQGKPLTDPLKAEPLFPNMLIQMVEVGEQSGSLSKMLGKAADIYDRDVDTITQSLSDLIEPIFMMLLAGMVGVTAIAIYLPYISIGDVISE